MRREDGFDPASANRYETVFTVGNGYLGMRGKQPGGPEEQAEQARFDGDTGYKAALLSTLKRTRELLGEGKL